MDDRKIILTIDDDEDINILYSKVLSRDGFNVITTTSLDQFFLKFKESPPHLCIVDLNIDEGKGAGFTIIKAIRNKLGKNIHLLVVSRRNDPSDIERCIESGANDYLQKPVDNIILLAKVNSFFDNLFKSSLDLPYFAVPATSRDLKINLPLEFLFMNEHEIECFSNHFIAKGTIVSLTGSFFMKINENSVIQTFVKEVNLNKERNGYNIKLEFYSENRDLTINLRKFLLNLN